MADKRIYELTEASTVGSSDVLALDSQNMAQTKKVKVSTITDPLSDKNDIASLSLTGSTNTSGGTIEAGRYFYLNGDLVKAKTDIAAGATFTAGTNYVAAYIGSDLAEVKSDLTKYSTKTITTDYGVNVYLKKQGRVVMLNIGGDVSTDIGRSTTICTLPSAARPVGNIFFAAFDQNERETSPYTVTIKAGYMSIDGKIQPGLFDQGSKLRIIGTIYIAEDDTLLT